MIIQATQMQLSDQSTHHSVVICRSLQELNSPQLDERDWSRVHRPRCSSGQVLQGAASP